MILWGWQFRRLSWDHHLCFLWCQQGLRLNVQLVGRRLRAAGWDCWLAASFSSMWPLIFQKASLSFFLWVEAFQETEGVAEESHIISHLPHSVGQSKSLGQHRFKRWEHRLQHLMGGNHLWPCFIYHSVFPLAMIISISPILPPRTLKVTFHHGIWSEVHELTICIGSVCTLGFLVQHFGSSFSWLRDSWTKKTIIYPTHTLHTVMR